MSPVVQKLMVAVIGGLLGAGGVCGVSQSAALAASSPGLTWTKQALAASPSPRWDASMAYDAATGAVVLFGGGSASPLGDTWTWGPG